MRVLRLNLTVGAWYMENGVFCLRLFQVNVARRMDMGMDMGMGIGMGIRIRMEIGRYVSPTAAASRVVMAGDSSLSRPTTTMTSICRQPFGFVFVSFGQVRWYWPGNGGDWRCGMLDARCTMQDAGWRMANAKAKCTWLWQIENKLAIEMAMQRCHRFWALTALTRQLEECNKVSWLYGRLWLSLLRPFAVARDFAEPPSSMDAKMLYVMRMAVWFGQMANGGA